ncbi:MAG: FecR domain-containing protein [Candidatus Goldbacteria bacterium]|nr:FecR domain-containing protein [Candidatus Goldiibacteriota bacterium]
MKNITRTLLAVICLVFMSLNLNAASIIHSIAVVSDYGGEAYVTAPGAKKRANASISMPVFEGASIKTLSDSYIEITFDDATMVRLESNAELKLTELKRDKSAVTVFNLLKGRLLAVVDKLRDTDSTFEIHTKMAVAAIKGTELAIDADDNGASLGVNEGLVAFFAQGNNNRIMVGKGKESRLNKGALRPSSPSDLSSMWKFERRFDSMREEIKVIRQLKQENGDAVIQYMIKKKLQKEGKTEGKAETKLTLGGKDANDTKNAQSRIRHHFKNKLRGEMNSALKHSWEDLRFVNGEMKADLHLGKNMTDVKGRRVRIEEYVFRPTPNQVDLLSITLRDDRIDYLRAMNMFNTPLPKIIPASAWQKAWVSIDMPKFYRTQERVVISNTEHRVETMLKYGYQEAVVGGNGYEMVVFDNYADDKYLFAQPKQLGTDSALWVLPEYEKALWIDGDIKEHQKFVADRTMLWQHDPMEYRWIKMADDKTFTNEVSLIYPDKSDIEYAAWISTGSTTGNTLNPEENYLAVSNSFDANAVKFVKLTEAPNKLLNSDLKWTELKRYNDGSWLKTEMYLINDYGKIQQWNGTVRDFADIIKFTNVELNLTSSAFNGQDIDIVSKLLWWTMLNPNN